MKIGQIANFANYLVPINSYLNFVKLQQCAVLKVVNGELELPCLPHSPDLPPPPSPRSEEHQWTGRLEVGLKPVLCVGVGIGNVDTEAAIFTQDDQSGTTLESL